MGRYGNDNEMEKYTLRLPEQMKKQLGALVEDGVYPNRSEAARAALREKLDEHDAEDRLRRQQRIGVSDGGRDA